MKRYFRRILHGYTIVELMVTIVIVSFLSATVGVLFIHLLTIQEKEREEGYIREKLADICGEYADWLSIGLSFGTNNAGFFVTYPKETSGVTLEYGGRFLDTTGLVARVIQLESRGSVLNTMTGDTTLGLKFYTSNIESNGVDNLVEMSRYSRNFRGDDTPLIPLKDLLPIKKGNDINDAVKITLSNKVSPLYDENNALYAGLGRLEVAARYDYEMEKANGNRILTNTTVTLERVVRLWNHE